MFGAVVWIPLGIPHPMLEYLGSNPGSTSYFNVLLMHDAYTGKQQVQVIVFLPSMWDVQIKFQAPGFDLAQTSYCEHLEELIRKSKTSFCLSFVCMCVCVSVYVCACTCDMCA